MMYLPSWQALSVSAPMLKRLRSVKANVELFSIIRTANERPSSSVASQISDIPPELINSCSV